MTNHRKAYFFALAMFLLSLFMPYLGMSALLHGLLYGFSYITLPLAKAIGPVSIGDPWTMIFTLLWQSLLFFFLWYGFARFWLVSSRHFKFSIVGIVFAGSLTFWAFNAYKNRFDWTARGLNPDRPGFKPDAVLLAGTFEYFIKNDYQPKSGTGFFEIRMNGRDHYYCKKWRGHEWKVGSWYRIELAKEDFSQSWQLNYRRHTIRGGGGGWRGPDDIVLCRRLWNGNEFVGAKQDQLEVESKQWNRKEEFKDLIPFGPYLIPKTVRLTEKGRSEETYTIKKVEFANQPSKEWFEQIKQKYFDRDPDLRAMNLNEPGIGPRRK